MQIELINSIKAIVIESSINVQYTPPRSRFISRVDRNEAYIGAQLIETLTNSNC